MYYDRYLKYNEYYKYLNEYHAPVFNKYDMDNYF